MFEVPQLGGIHALELDFGPFGGSGQLCNTPPLRASAGAARLRHWNSGLPCSPQLAA